MVLDVNTDQQAPIFAQDNSVWSPHLVVHVHNSETKGLVQKGVRVYPGQETEVRLRLVTTQMTNTFPFTNCTNDPAAIDPELCEEECLAKTVAQRCCSSTIDPLSGIATPRIEQDPMLICPHAVTEEFEVCKKAVDRDSHSGLVCKHPDDLATSRADRFGWYDTSSEGQKLQIEELVRKGDSRLYCPTLCNRQSLEPTIATSGTVLTDGAALAIASQMVYTDPAKVEKMTRQAACAVSPDGCIPATVEYVKKNFAVIHVLYDTFAVETIQISPAMSAFSLFGTIGGNLGMWVGISMMTIIEALEWLAVAALAGLCFVGCCSKQPRPNNETLTAPQPAEVGALPPIQEYGVLSPQQAITQMPLVPVFMFEPLVQAGSASSTPARPLPVMRSVLAQGSSPEHGYA